MRPSVVTFNILKSILWETYQRMSVSHHSLKGEKTREKEGKKSTSKNYSPALPA
jgi:hypothetical protein